MILKGLVIVSIVVLCWLVLAEPAMKVGKRISNKLSEMYNGDKDNG